MNHQSLISTQHLAVWEIVRPHAHEPIKKVKKVERDFEENKISLEWGFSTKRRDDAYRAYEVELTDIFRKKVSVEIFQEEVMKNSPKYDQKVEVSIKVKKAESKKLLDYTYILSKGENMVLNFSSLFRIDYVKIIFNEERNPFVDIARTTLKFSI
jgi:hypothetical protein